MKLIDMKKLVVVTTQKMEAFHPRNPKNNKGFSYEEIAHIWFSRIALMTYSLARYGDGQISVNTLRDNFTFSYTLAKRKHWWFDWFVQNAPLYNLVEKGSNFTGNSKGVPVYTRKEILDNMTGAEIVDVLNREAPADAVKEIIWVDRESLENYIKTSYGTLNDPRKGRAYKDRTRKNIPLALNIMSVLDAVNETQVCELTGKVRWALPQWYRDSAFGRRYYTGSLSLQGMNKTVRAAALGRCWEIDIDSSVYRFYKALADGNGIDTPMLDLLLTDKKHFRVTLAGCLQNISTDTDYLINKCVKPCITSLGFGATDGDYSSVSKIVKNTEDRNRLTGHPYWTGLKGEAQTIRDVVLKNYTDEIKEFKDNPDLKNGKRYSLNRFIAHFYQRYETAIMTQVWDSLVDSDRRPVLWVHDCVYTLRDPSWNGVVQGIQYDAQSVNPFVKFDVTYHDDWDYIDRQQQDIDLESHRQRMAMQQRIAEQKYGNPNKPSPQAQLRSLRWQQAFETPKQEYKPQEPYPGYFEDFYSENNH